MCSCSHLAYKLSSSPTHWYVSQIPIYLIDAYFVHRATCSPSCAKTNSQWTAHTAFTLMYTGLLPLLCTISDWHGARQRTQAYLTLPTSPRTHIKCASEGLRQVAASIVHLIPGHAFISSYTAHFLPHKQMVLLFCSCRQSGPELPRLFRFLIACLPATRCILLCVVHIVFGGVLD